LKKIPSIFIRDWDGNRELVTDQKNPECLWVFSGEGVATRKWDGTCVRIKDGELWVRYDAKNGKPAPEGFEPAQDAPDPETKHWPGWVKPGNSPQYKWQRDAFERRIARHEISGGTLDGTYEVVGPHFQGNPEQFSEDQLVPHGVMREPDAPREFLALAEWFKGKDIEGIVWHHPDGRMAKIKVKDFGIKRVPTGSQ
jgi:hypothetical protein